MTQTSRSKLPDYESMPEYWNGFVLQGKTRDERRARLAQVPEPFRDHVEAHVRTVFAIQKRWAELNRGQ